MGSGASTQDIEAQSDSDLALKFAELYKKNPERMEKVIQEGKQQASTGDTNEISPPPGANTSVSAEGSFEVPRDPEALRALVLEGLDLDRVQLALNRKALLPWEVAPLLEALVSELARREAAGEGLAGRPLRLVLGYNPIGPHGVKALREAAPRLPPLRALFLRECGLGVGGALELAELLATPSREGGATVGAHLEELYLSHNGLGEAGGRAVAEALPSVPKLKVLSLGENGLGAAGGRAVAAALPSVPKLEWLELRRNDLGAAGGRAVAEALPSVPKLEKLDLEGNDLGAEAEAAVRAASSSLPLGVRL